MYSRIVVLGKGGQLASEFEFLVKKNKDWKFLSVYDVDITNKINVLSYFKKNPCEIIINCAAYTNVDRAENEKNESFLVNELGVKNILAACKKINAKLIHYSTDFVFDGKSKVPYKEFDSTYPLNIYGLSKLAGENTIIESSVNSIIIRTSWLYSSFGNNFVKTMIKLISIREEIGVVSDQIGSPTFAQDLALATIKIIENQSYFWSVGDIFHYSNHGSCSWFEFAKEIFEIINADVQIKKLKSSEYLKSAIRPKYSLLDCTKIKNEFNLEIPKWRDSLKVMLNSEIKQK